MFVYYSLYAWLAQAKRFHLKRSICPVRKFPLSVFMKITAIGSWTSISTGAAWSLIAPEAAANAKRPESIAPENRPALTFAPRA
jgi:hypothetical protein